MENTTLGFLDADATQPEVNMLKCPGCDGEGSELNGVESCFGYRLKREKCVVCNGVGFVRRDVYEVWQCENRDTIV